MKFHLSKRKLIRSKSEKIAGLFLKYGRVKVSHKDKLIQITYLIKKKIGKVGKNKKITIRRRFLTNKKISFLIPKNPKEIQTPVSENVKIFMAQTRKNSKRIFIKKLAYKMFLPRQYLGLISKKYLIQGPVRNALQKYLKKIRKPKKIEKVPLKYFSIFSKPGVSKKISEKVPPKPVIPVILDKPVHGEVAKNVEAQKLISDKVSKQVPPDKVPAKLVLKVILKKVVSKKVISDEVNKKLVPGNESGNVVPDKVSVLVSKKIVPKIVGKNGRMKIAYPRKCPHCPFICTNETKYNHHQTWNHSDINQANMQKRLLTCIICEKSFESKDLLESHLDDFHRTSDKKKFKCDTCGISRKSIYRVKEHQIIHTDQFKCDKCEKRFDNSRSFIFHQAQHENKRKFSCKQCDKTYNTQVALTIHLRVAKDHTGRIIRCKVCPHLRFKDDDKLQEHKDLEHPEQIKYPRKCPDCPKSFRNKGSYQHHIIKHRSKNFTCLVCELKFSTRSLLKLHIGRWHITYLKNEPYKCDLCGISRKSIYSIKNHMNMHSGKHKCDICDKNFEMDINLQYHKAIHVNRREFECDQCDGKFNTHSQLRTHKIKTIGHTTSNVKCKRCPHLHFSCNKEVIEHRQLKHPDWITDKYPRKCNLCSEYLPTKMGYDTHIAKHKDLRFSCKYCKKGFLFKSIMEAHVRKIHAKSPSNHYQCDICGCIKYERYYFVMHLNVHTDKYKCPDCGERLEGASRLNHHKVKHANLLEFSCNFCDMKFNFEKYLFIHVQNIHSKRASFNCKWCSKKFKTIALLRNHKKVKHADVRVIKCKFKGCQKGFWLKENYEAHKLTHPQEDFPCTHKNCNKVFTSANQLSEHGKGHEKSRTRATTNFTCELCNEKLNSQKQLLAHNLENHVQKKLKLVLTKC